MTKVNNKINAIGEYSLFRKLIDGQFSGSYNLGIYSDKFGKKYFIKSYTGSKNDSEYRWLANESKIYSIINQNKLSNTIKFAKFKENIIDQKSFSIVLEYLEAKNISKMKSSQKALLYKEILILLQSKKFSKPLLDSKILKYRNPYYWISISLYIAIIAALKNIGYSKAIFKNLFGFLKSSKELILSYKPCIVHRDLNDNNILEKSGSFYLIDFELMCVGDPLIDFALVSLRNNSDSFKVIFRELLNEKKIARKNSDKIIDAYKKIFAIYDLFIGSDTQKLSLSYLNKVNT